VPAGGVSGGRAACGSGMGRRAGRRGGVPGGLAACRRAAWGGQAGCRVHTAQASRRVVKLISDEQARVRCWQAGGLQGRKAECLCLVGRMATVVQPRSNPNTRLAKGLIH
jgi:hypothetical protein